MSIENTPGLRATRRGAHLCETAAGAGDAAAENMQKKRRHHLDEVGWASRVAQGAANCASGAPRTVERASQVDHRLVLEAWTERGARPQRSVRHPAVLVARRLPADHRRAAARLRHDQKARAATVDTEPRRATASRGVRTHLYREFAHRLSAQKMQMARPPTISATTSRTAAAGELRRRWRCTRAPPAPPARTSTQTTTSVTPAIIVVNPRRCAAPESRAEPEDGGERVEEDGEARRAAPRRADEPARSRTSPG